MTQNNNKEEYEYMLDPNNTRLTVLPIQDQEIWDHYRKMQNANWVAQELDFSHDYDDFQKLNPNSQHFIKMVLAFFAASDSIVNMNLGKRFLNEVTVLEAQIAYTFQMMIENVHAETYSLMIDNLIRDKEEKKKLLEGIANYDCIRKKAEWAIKWTNSDAPFVQRVIAFACVEGIFFSGSFAAIYWVKEMNLMPGLVRSNEFISRDEGMHTTMACIMKRKCSTILDQTIVHDMFRDAVSVEKDFICEAIPCSLLGINKELMSQYIEYVADRLLETLGYDKIWKSEMPLDFMNKISMQGKANFFDVRSTQYQSSRVLNPVKKNTYDLSSDDF